MMDEIICGRFGSGRGQPWSRDYVRVVSWNIERGLQFSAILDFLRSAEADLILLQEVDLNVRRTRYLDVAYELAKSLRLNYVFGKEFQELSAGRCGSPAYHGLATLSPWPISNGRLIRFRRQSIFWKPRWYIPQIALFQRRLGGRISLVADTFIDHQRSVTYNLHLESRGKDSLRLGQLGETLEDIRPQSDSTWMLAMTVLRRRSRPPGSMMGLSNFRSRPPFLAGYFSATARLTGSTSQAKPDRRGKCTIQFEPRTTILFPPHLRNLGGTAEDSAEGDQ